MYCTTERKKMQASLLLTEVNCSYDGKIEINKEIENSRGWLVLF